MSYDNVGPHTVSANLSSRMYGYVMRMVDLGAIDGALGNMKPNPGLKPVIEALHHVLAGGTVEMKIVEPGSPDLVRDLTNRLEGAIEESNTINTKSGYYVTLVP